MCLRSANELINDEKMTTYESNGYVGGLSVVDTDTTRMAAAADGRWLESFVETPTKSLFIPSSPHPTLPLVSKTNPGIDSFLC